jgi:hypothetical protein
MAQSAQPVPVPGANPSAGAGAATLEPLRGDIPPTACMEALQNGYLRAIAAAAGCAIAKPEPDTQGIDWDITHPSAHHTSDPLAQIKIQLKSTTQLAPSLLEGKRDFPITLDNSHLKKLNPSPVTFVRLLVAMIIPGDMAEWVSSNGRALELRHCAYWVNLEGKEVTGLRKTTVRVPMQNVFDDIGLCRIMRIVGTGETPR